MQELKASVIYFLIVFGAGFTLGPIRIFWVVPRFGARMAELLEAPIMIGVTFVAAKWVVGRFRLPTRLSSRAAMGGVALLLMLLAEFTLVLWLRGISITEYFSNRDPVAGAIYYFSLALLAVMPLLVDR